MHYCDHYHHHQPLKNLNVLLRVKSRERAFIKFEGSVKHPSLIGPHQSAVYFAFVHQGKNKIMD